MNIKDYCDKIADAAQSIYVKGCDGVAQNNMAQLMIIVDAVGKIRAMQDNPPRGGTT